MPQEQTCRKPYFHPQFSLPNLLFWLLSGMGMIFLAIILWRGPLGKSLAGKTARQASPTLPTTVLGTSPPPPSQQKQQQAIQLIKKHPLVRDADISAINNSLHLALLVTDKTPVADAERLGRSFAHYLFDEIDNRKMPRTPALISVYYPQGSCVTVGINEIESEEEEVLGNRAEGDHIPGRNQ
ncbi:MAG TPA: hypothetical protein ENN66_00610 [Proteobacteria bacterium]|mgnify:CR=1 FL=1|nr:hypothetical protein [Pseudomonadota bacterium]